MLGLNYIDQFYRKKNVLYISNRLSQINTQSVKISCIVIISLLIGFYLWGPNFNAKWWIIDDHEIINHLGTDGKLKLSEFLHQLQLTEVTLWGKSVRYRPSYYVLRFFELCLWGDSPFFWYFFRFLIFAGSLSILWYIVQRRIGFFYSGIFITFVLSFSFWGKIFTTLGPAEQYGVIGTALYFLGFDNCLESLKFNYSKKNILKKSDILLIFVGSIIAMGSKENFLLLMMPTLFLTVYAYKKRNLNLYVLVNAAITIGYGIFIGLGILLAVSKTGTDVYANSVSIQSRTGLLISAMPGILKTFKVHLVIPIMFLFGVLVSLIKKGTSGKVAKLLKTFTLFSVIICLIYLSQIIYYNGNWPTDGHYDFPGMLAIQFYWLAVVVTIIRMLDLLCESLLIRRIAIIMVVIFAIFYFKPVDKFHNLRQKSLYNKVKTEKFTKAILDIVSEAKKYKDIPIIFESFHALDYEPIASVNRFLHAYEVKNSRYLRMNEYSDETYSNLLYKMLATQLYVVSTMGKVDDPSNCFNFSPISELNFNGERCLVIEFTGSKETICKKYHIQITH